MKTSADCKNDIKSYNDLLNKYNITEDILAKLKRANEKAVIAKKNLEQLEVNKFYILHLKNKIDGTWFIYPKYFLSYESARRFMSYNRKSITWNMYECFIKCLTQDGSQELYNVVSNRAFTCLKAYYNMDTLEDFIDWARNHNIRELRKMPNCGTSTFHELCRVALEHNAISQDEYNKIFHTH